MNKTNTSAPTVTVAFWLVCVITAAWILPGLIGHDPWKPDEAYTFGVVFDFLHGSGWVVPTLAQEPFLDRPPFYTLTAAGFSWLLSWGFSTHDAARLITGLYMALTFCFVGLAAREWYGRGYGRLASLTLLGCFGLVLRCHQLITDVALLTGYAIAFYGLALAPRRNLLGGFWFGTGVGIAFMTRGVLPPLVFLIVALSLPAFLQWRAMLFNKRYFIVMAIALIAAAPWLLIWPILLYQKSPTLFHTWLWDENLNDFVTGNHVSGSLYYLSLLLWYGLPALPLALWTLWRLRKRLSEARVGVPLLTFILLLAALSFSSERHELYALPLLLPLTLLATPASDTLRRGAANLIYWFSMMSAGVFILAAWFYWIALDLGWPDRLHAHLLKLLPNYMPAFHLWSVLLAAIYTVAWIAVLVSLKRDPRRPIVAWAASATVMWGLAALLFSSAIDSSKSYRTFAANLQQAMPAQYRCIASRGLTDSQRGMLEYFAGIVTEREENATAKQSHRCDLLLVQDTAKTAELSGGTWRRIWQTTRSGDKAEYYRLYQRIH